MKLYSVVIVLFTFFVFGSFGSHNSGNNQKNQNLKIDFVAHDKENKIDVMVDGKLFTSYCWYENVYKPVLFPVCTSTGNIVTRGFPLKPREGERADHPHQVGIWLNYGNVNGYDFWDNGESGSKDPKGGEVKHVKIQKLLKGIGEGVMVTTESWLDPAGKELLSENTEYHFIARGEVRIIDRITTLKATGEKVTFADTKEGMFAIRVARQLELPLNDSLILINSKGNVNTVKTMTIEGITGNYFSSEGVTGLDVWGKRARWMELSGSIANEKTAVVICDHPKNPGYPTYWHARGYGLFSANPLGVKDFTDGKKELNFSIPAGGSATFRYRVVIHSGSQLTKAEIDTFANDFEKKY